MLNRLIGGVLVLALVITTGSTAAELSDGPRLAVLRFPPDRTKAKIVTLGPSASAYRPLFPPSKAKQELGVLSVPAWSPDGTEIAFSRMRGTHSEISLISADGSELRSVPTTRGGVLPVFAPDGKSLAFSRFRREKHGLHGPYESTSVWIVDLETGESRQLTLWRDHLEQYASSFSPDGTTLLITRSDYDRRSGEPEIVALHFDGRTSGLLVGHGLFPAYSPDGSQIALFRFHGRNEQSDLYVIDADGANLRRLTHTRSQDELFASWDPSGERIAYSSFREFEPREEAALVQINADGTCPTTVLSQPNVAFVGPVWQPGPGREAGRIAC
jgi:Tol biopolymer transport system component